MWISIYRIPVFAKYSMAPPKYKNIIAKYDVDRDNRVSQVDLQEANTMMELDLREEKANAQKRMAWVALITMLGVTAVLFSPVVTDSRVKALADLLGLFYIAEAGIVGAYMGVTAWMSNAATSRSPYSSYSSSYHRTSQIDDEEPTETTDKDVTIEKKG